MGASDVAQSKDLSVYRPHRLGRAVFHAACRLLHWLCT